MACVCVCGTADERETVDLEEELDVIGVGRFHYMAGCICGLANAADAVELMSVSFILPLVTDTSSASGEWELG